MSKYENIVKNILADGIHQTCEYNSLAVILDIMEEDGELPDDLSGGKYPNCEYDEDNQIITIGCEKFQISITPIER